jgi:acetate kinase
LKVFAYRVKKYIGAYMAAMGGIDAIVFTAGIGEQSPFMRKLILSGLEGLGIKLDDAKNENPVAHGWVISSDDSKVKILVIPTDEELVIAEETLKKVQELQGKR